MAFAALEGLLREVVDLLGWKFGELPEIEKGPFVERHLKVIPQAVTGIEVPLP